jgi:hypothetical protein
MEKHRRKGKDQAMRMDVKKIKIANQENLVVVQMEKHLHRVQKNKVASHAQRKCMTVTNVKKQNLDAVQIFRMLQQAQILKDVLMKKVREFMKTALSPIMVVAPMVSQRLKE